MTDRTYLAIDLKSFYASAECVARGLDPLDTNLVVADASRTSKTICLAVSPSLKAVGIGVLTQISAGVCDDAKQSAVARLVELCGGLLALYAALPLLEAVLELIETVGGG